MGIGVVIRDGNGDFSAAFSKRINGTLGPVSDEAVAFFYAGDFALISGYFNVIFEGDAQSIINLINKKSNSLVAYGHIIDDCKRLSSFVKLYSWSFIRRRGNSIAHCLANMQKKSQIIVVGWRRLRISCYLPSKLI